MKIKIKIIVIILELGLIPLLILSFISYSAIKKQIVRDTFQKLDALAQIQKNRLQDILQYKMDELNLFRSRSTLRSNLRDFNITPTPVLQESMNTITLAAQTSVTAIKKIFIVNKTGAIIVSTDTSLLGKDVSTEDFFTRGIRQNDISILRKDSISGKITHYLAGPMILDGAILGVAVMMMDAEDIFSTTNDYTGLGDTGEIMLARNDGSGNALFITPSRFDPNTALTQVVPKERVAVPSVHAVAGEERIFESATDYQGMPVLAVTRYIQDVGWGIIVKINRAEAFAPIQKMRDLFLFLIIAATFFIILIGVLVARSISDPILRLIDAVKKIEQGDFSQNVEVVSRDEIGVLGKVFNTMTVKLKESYALLEKKVRDRTKELNERTKELEHVNKYMVGRELVMVKLKEELRKLKDKLK